jgi:hypothetical protein
MKAGGKGKKRASTATAPTSRKRRKTSDVSEGMTVTKPTGKKPTTRSKKNEVSEERAQAVDDPSNSIRPNNVSGTGADNGTPRSVPVYTPPTSMDSIHNVAQKTSVDALKDANGRGTTLYRRTQTLALPQANISYAQPWLNEQAAVADQGDTAVEGRRLRPRRRDIQYAENAATAVKVQKKAQTTSTRSKQTNAPSKTKKASKQAASRKSSRTSEEDFLGEDDLDEAAVLALTRDIKQAGPGKGECEKASSNSQLPTPVTSDEPVVPAISILRPQSKREATPILTLDEEFIVSDNEGQDEIAELVDAVEEAEARRSSTPPARERKLNMREVDKHEDYGGALLSNEERQLLGKRLKLSLSPSLILRTCPEFARD